MHQEGKTVPAIAERLNEEGFVPPRRRGVFAVGTLAPIMQRLGLVGELYRDDLLGLDEWWIRDLAVKLEIRPQGALLDNPRLAPFPQDRSGKHWIVWADEDELNRLEKLKVQSNSYTAKRNPELVTPKARKG